jgi:hypothetical protein
MEEESRRLKRQRKKRKRDRGCREENKRGCEEEGGEEFLFYALKEHRKSAT